MARKLVAYLGADRALGALEELERDGALPSSQPPAQSPSRPAQAETR